MKKENVFLCSIPKVYFRRSLYKAEFTEDKSSCYQPHLLNKMPCEAMVGGVLQFHLVVHMRSKGLTTAHHQVELYHIWSSNLHGLCLHVAHTRGQLWISCKTERRKERIRIDPQNNSKKSIMNGSGLNTVVLLCSVDWHVGWDHAQKNLSAGTCANYQEGLDVSQNVKH